VDGIPNRASQVAPGRSNLITLALGLGTFLTLFDVTAVVVAMPGIARELGFAVAGAAWVIDAYSLATLYDDYQDYTEVPSALLTVWGVDLEFCGSRGVGY